MKKSSILLLLLVCPAMIGLAQTNFREGFIITLEGDTVSGEIDYRSNLKNHRVCRFRNDGEVREFSPAELTGYRYNNDTYYSSQVVEGSFVEVLVDGELSLYRLGTLFYLRKSGDKLYKLESLEEKVTIKGNEGLRKNSRWKGIVIYLTSDCPSGGSDPKMLDLGERSLTAVVNRYNRCKGTPDIVYKEKKAWAHAEIGVSAGMVQSSIAVTSSTLYLSDRYETLSPAFGIVTAISSPRVSERFAFQPEIHFSKSSYTALVVRGTSPNTTYYDTFIDLTTVSVPLAFRYSFPVRKYSVHLLAGVNGDFQVRSSTRALVKAVITDRVMTWELNSFGISRNQLGYGGGLAVSRAFGKLNTALAMRYFSMNNLSGAGDVMATMQKLFLSIQLTRK